MEEYKILYKKETKVKVNIVAMSTRDSCKCPSCGTIMIPEIKTDKSIRIS